MKILEVKGLTKYFGGLATVKDVDLALEEGEMLAVVGPNGAGKNLRTIARSWPAVAGSLRQRIWKGGTGSGKESSPWWPDRDPSNFGRHESL